MFNLDIMDKEIKLYENIITNNVMLNQHICDLDSNSILLDSA